MVFLFFSLFPFQEDEADVSEEVKAALVSGKPVRHVPFSSASLMCIQFREKRAGPMQI